MDACGCPCNQDPTNNIIKPFFLFICTTVCPEHTRRLFMSEHCGSLKSWHVEVLCVAHSVRLFCTHFGTKRSTVEFAPNDQRSWKAKLLLGHLMMLQ
eukprot:scaffold96864_cov17-Tisochrysis_lutea.AAC.3